MLSTTAPRHAPTRSTTSTPWGLPPSARASDRPSAWTPAILERVGVRVGVVGVSDHR
jgi:hypothetical protein